MKRSLDRRAFTRVPHTARAVVSTGDGEVEAKVVDLSVAGLQLEVRSTLERGEFVRVRLPLSPGDETSWVDPDALVVRTEPSPIYGCSRVGLSFLAVSPAVLQRLSDRVAQALAEEDASTDSPAPAAPAAEAGAHRPAPKKNPSPAMSASRAAQPRNRQPNASKPPHRAPPSAAANGPTKKPGIVETLARLFSRRAKAASEPNKPPVAPSSTADAPASRAEVRDLFRSAVASVKGEDTKPGKR